MNRATLTTLAALAALAACNHDGVPPDVPEDDEQQDPDDDLDRTARTALADGHVTRDELASVDAELGESLDRLAALEILEVGALIVATPMGAQNCYGPCEDHPDGQAWMQAHTRQVDRLHDFVDTAERVARDTRSTAPWSEAEAAVHALAELKLIEIESIYQESPNCYVGNCPGDPRRAAVLAALAKAVREP